MSGGGSGGDNDYWTKEWDSARGLIETCSDRANDIRKLGFGLVSTSLTAEVLVKYKATDSLGGPTGFVLLLVVLATLLGIRLYEKEMQLVRGAAATRARTLEMLASVELTDVITDRHQLDDWPWYRSLVYAIFGFVGVAVSIAVSGPGAWLWPGVTAGVIYEGAIIALTMVDINMENGVDVAFDRVECKVDDYVSIVAVNLHDDVQLVNDPLLVITRVPALWLTSADAPQALVDDSCSTPLHLPTGPGFGRHHLRSLQAVTWVWQPKKEGVYVVRRVRSDLRDKPGEDVDLVEETRTYRRMLRVLPPASPEPREAPSAQTKPEKVRN
jgi:hypothetical protein